MLQTVENNFTFNLSSAGGGDSSPAETEESSSELENSSEISEDTSEDTSELSSETVYVDYSEQLSSIQSGLSDLNYKLDISVTMFFIALAICVTVIFFRIFNWFWKDL